MRWVATSVRLTNAPIDQMCHPNCNDQIAARAFGATVHYSPVTELIRHQDEYDAVFVTMSKVREHFERRWMDAVHWLKCIGKTVVLFQEAETSWPMTRSWEEIESFIQLLGKVDLFLTHNFRDVTHWGSLAKASLRWRTCLDISHATERIIEPGKKTMRALLCGSSYDDRANGITALMACGSMSGHPLWHQNRSTGYGDRNKDLPALLGLHIDHEIEHCGWNEWLEQISKTYIAVHPMPAAAAGRDQIAFAALGVPCIGNGELDIQRELFPELCLTDIFDVEAIRTLIRKLLDDRGFYSYCRDMALKRVQSYGLANAAEQAARIKGMMGWQ